MVDLSYMSRDRVIQDLANARLNKKGYGSQYLAAMYGDQGLSNILNEFGINQTEILDAADSIRSGEVSPPSGTQPPPAPPPALTLPGERATVLPTEKVLTPGLPLAAVSPLSKIGITSLDANLRGTGESLRGRGEGILSIGTPGTGFQDLGSGFGPATYDLQESIRDQARAAEDEAARTGPSLAEQQQQVRNTFLDALQSEEGQGGGALGTAANVASTGITGAKLAGVTMPPALLLGQLANTFRNVYRQTQDDKLINNPSWLGTIMRSMGLENFPGVHQTVPRGGGLPFHPTPAQSEILSTDPGPPVTLPPKRPPVAIETLAPPSQRIPTTHPNLFGLAQQFGRGRLHPLMRPAVTPPEAGDIEHAPSYDPFSEAFVDWAE